MYDSSIGIHGLIYGPLWCLRSRYPKCTIVNMVLDWVFVIFLNAVDCELLFCMFQFTLTAILITVVMILWVYAIWTWSKWILDLLLFIYVPQVIITIIFAGVYNSSTTYLLGMSGINFPWDSNLTQVSIHHLPPFSPRFLRQKLLHFWYYCLVYLHVVLGLAGHWLVPVVLIWLGM